jgi:hypothetical protein
MSSTHDEDRLESTFITFACGPDFPDRRPFLHEHPELLTENARKIIERVIQDKIAGQHVLSPLSQLRWMAALLRRAVEIGIDEAFAEFSPPPRETFLAISKLIRTQTIRETFTVLIDHFKGVNMRDARSALHFLRCLHADDSIRLQMLNTIEGEIEMINASRTDPGDVGGADPSRARTRT